MMTKQYDFSPEFGPTDEFRWLGPAETIRDNLPMVRIASASKYEMASIEKLPLVLELIVDGVEHDALGFARLIDWQVAASFEIVCCGARTDGFDWLRSVGVG
jgi:hypothetical protein